MNMNLQNVLIASALMMLVSTGTGAPEPAHSPTTQINRLDGEGWLIATDDKNQGRRARCRRRFRAITGWYGIGKPSTPLAIPIRKAGICCASSRWITKPMFG